MSIKKINEVSVAKYGVQVVELNATSAMWLADAILLETGKNVYKTISNHRNKLGLGTAFPSYDTELFRAI
jgi:hypothetical protein